MSQCTTLTQGGALWGPCGRALPCERHPDGPTLPTVTIHVELVVSGPFDPDDFAEACAEAIGNSEDPRVDDVVASVVNWTVSP